MNLSYLILSVAKLKQKNITTGIVYKKGLKNRHHEILMSESEFLEFSLEL
jgi:hypothetical protein